ncbi:hypothetical protein CISG_06611 [Coccidioides immitis RMSCC 3703]|uniref:Uncharacterized protein n=1 Tax=Coccidioides immitis RMSCC 3703 TaxID=454286 RepID=A0A0J8R119_COCIT|nr:hypothetical protein CISG_06611 [Coccidioides immitis RMSCC 3703]
MPGGGTRSPCQISETASASLQNRFYGKLCSKHLNFPLNEQKANSFPPIPPAYMSRNRNTIAWVGSWSSDAGNEAFSKPGVPASKCFLPHLLILVSNVVPTIGHGRSKGNESSTIKGGFNLTATFALLVERLCA